jgi:peptide deformylase
MSMTTPLTIVEYPHPALRVTCKPVTTIDKDVVMAAGQMLELMYKHEGLGLAAPQVALDYRLLVINFTGKAEDKENEFVAINPVIVDQKGTIKDREGCLSFPNLYQDIRRAKTVTVQGYTLDGKGFEMTCSDLPARIWQHEIDHLNGVMFIDKMGPIARMSSKKDLETFIAAFEKKKRKGELPSDMAAAL